MKSYQLIQQLIGLVAELEEQNQGEEISIQDFTGFLSTRINASDITDHKIVSLNKDPRFGNESHQAIENAYRLENNIGRLFIFMSRYAKSYIKKALDGTPLQSAEDFTALAILLTHTELSKSQLISYNLQEKTSGTEVIRRLIVAGLVKQWDDVKDKRSRSIAITAAGRDLLYQVFLDMDHVGKVITGKLTDSEKLTLQYLLQKLETFHLSHYESKSILNKEDLRNIAGQE